MSAMARLFVLLIVGLVIAVLAAACADDNKASTGSQVGASPSERRAAAEKAVAPADQEAFRNSVKGRGIVQETCAYEEDAAIADCGERGRFALEPPPTGPDASCVVGLSASSPVYVICTVASESKFYQVGA
jgi:hypothetical protein